MATTAERAKQVFEQVVAQGRGQVEEVRQRRQRTHYLTELGELAYRRAEGDSGLDTEIARLVETIRTLTDEPVPTAPDPAEQDVAKSVEESDPTEEE